MHIFSFIPAFKNPGLPAESSTQTTITQQLSPSWNDQLKITFDSEVTDYLPLYKARVEMKWQLGPRVKNGIRSHSINHTSLGASITTPTVNLPNSSSSVWLSLKVYSNTNTEPRAEDERYERKKKIKNTQKTKPNYVRSLDTKPPREKNPLNTNKQLQQEWKQTISYYTSHLACLMSI